MAILIIRSRLVIYELFVDTFYCFKLSLTIIDFTLEMTKSPLIAIVLVI